MVKSFFYHALKVDNQLCYGCSKCMMSCPTEAIRVRHGKATIFDNHCIDCGKCYEVCPVNAIYIQQDDLENIRSYKHRIAIVPNVFFGQFPENFTFQKICDAIKHFGFTKIAVAEYGVPFLIEEINNYLNQKDTIKPVISSFCPAIVRLIQVKFPTLTPNILLLKTPLDITALTIRHELISNNILPEDIGIFYITPCAAKIAAVKSPVGEQISAIDGVINMDTLFNQVLTYLKNNKTEITDTHKEKEVNIDPVSASWALTYGEASIIPGNTIAVDGIQNVTEFLEKVENEEMSDLDFIELRSCRESCAGGSLVTNNKFLISEKIKKSVPKNYSFKLPEISDVFKKYNSFLKDNIVVDKVTPRNMMKLDENIVVAMQKLDTISKLMRILPQTDCSACGSPNCNSLAHDIANQEAKIEQCIFIQKNMELKNKLTPEQSHIIMVDIWGKNKFNNNQ